ncbi:MAG: winged helix-turn-helix domain-containing protein [Thermodesulfobacteriota bacterium]
MKAGFKIWIDNQGKAFGDGPYELLRRVEKTHSLHQAALQMKMSYSKAWRLIRTMEERLGLVLLHRKVGGALGGGSQVTSEAKDLMKRYKMFRQEAEVALGKIFNDHFQSLKRRPYK